MVVLVVVIEVVAVVVGMRFVAVAEIVEAVKLGFVDFGSGLDSGFGLVQRQ